MAMLGPRAQHLVRHVNDATATPIFIDYHLAPAWYEGVDAVIEDLAALAPQQPAAALLLAEHTIQRLEHADLDDSDGWLTQAFPQLERIHAVACEQLGLGGSELAERLRLLADASGMEAFHDAPYTHASTLGDAGINRLLRPPPQ